jgi:hypothetical protein
MAAPQDPNRIDVSLNIMSDATLQAVNNLAGQMGALRELISSQGVTNPGARADSLGRAAAYVQSAVTGTPGAVPQRPNIVMGPEPSNPSQGAQSSAERRAELQREYREYMDSLKGGGIPDRPSPEAERLMGHEIGDVQRWALARREKKANERTGGRYPYAESTMDRFFHLYPGAARDTGEDGAYDFEAGIPRGSSSALPQGISPGASVPPVAPRGGEGDDMGGFVPGGGPGWQQALRREGITPDSRLALTIPRLGEFTIQDKLNMVAQWMGRAAQRHGTFDPESQRMEYGPLASRVGRTAASAAYLRDQSAAIVQVQREFARLREFARGEELSGEALGFSRESALGDIEALGAGMRLNLGATSEAQREALHQELTQRRVQLAPGVSGEEAQRIRNIVQGMGYSGTTNERLQYDLFRPLQQRGIAPEGVAPLIDQGIRQGNMSMATLRDTMIDLADAARNANMTLEDVTTATLEYAEGVQEIGANYEDALRNATTFTRSGIDPRIAGQAMQSPMVQGILGIQSGLPPQLQGIISAPGVMAGMGQAIEQGLAMGAPYANMPDRTIRTASGEEIEVSTGKDAQVAMAQQMTGLPRQIIERYMEDPNFLQAGGEAQAMVGQLQESVQGLTRRQRTVTERVGKMGRAARPGSSRMVTRTEGYTAELSDDQRRRLETGVTGDRVVQYDELERQMIEMDPKNREWTDRVRKIRREHPDIEKRLGHAQRIIGEAVNVKPEPDYMIGLTDEARKILKIEKPKDRNAPLPRANAGGSPANSGLQGPGFPSSTGGALSYGRQGGP